MPELPKEFVPMFVHPPCPQCVFLGWYKKPGTLIGEADLYFCAQGGIPTVIARFSNEPGDYQSGLPLSESLPWLSEAARRALDQGLLKPDHVVRKLPPFSSHPTGDQTIADVVGGKPCQDENRVIVMTLIAVQQERDAIKEECETLKQVLHAIVCADPVLMGRHLVDVLEHLTPEANSKVKAALAHQLHEAMNLCTEQMGTCYDEQDIEAFQPPPPPSLGLQD